MAAGFGLNCVVEPARYWLPDRVSREAAMGAIDILLIVLGIALVGLLIVRFRG